MDVTLHHDGSELFLQESPGQLKLALLARGDVRQVFVRTAPDGKEKMDAMVRHPEHPDWWTVELSVQNPHLRYRFLVMTRDHGGWYYTPRGTSRSIPTDSHDFRYLSRAELPAWVREAVFYQIFPDRFYDGDPSNNVRSGEYSLGGRPVVARNWYDPPDLHGGHLEFYGGDLQGITQKLSYLQNLGVTALYLTPIFTAPSSHKYDVSDFTNVDPHFGGNEALVELTRALHERGMKLILDVIPNHVGNLHPWFQEALLNPLAATAEFFTFHEHPAMYEMWEGEATLPKLNYRSARLLGEIQGTLSYWLREPYSIDGWRLDVANMMARQGEIQLAHEVGQKLRLAVKGTSADAYFLGENFYDASPHLQGDELDAVMNYRGFMMPVVHWLSGRDMPAHLEWKFGDTTPTMGWDMTAQWQNYLAVIPWQVARIQFNLLGSHDTPRIRTVLGDDVGKLEAAFTLLFTFPGAPCVYYGDEVGLAGGRDPLNRATMPWDARLWHEEIRALVKRLMDLRKNTSALIRGGFQVLAATADRVVFRRMASGQRVVVDVSRCACGPLELPATVGSLRGLLGGGETAGRLPGRDRAGAEVYVEEGGEFAGVASVLEVPAAVGQV